MAHYKILELPGREVVAPLEGQAPLKSQDEAKIVLQQLRAKARKEKRQVDFVIGRTKDLDGSSTTGSTAGGTSIRLTEEVRRRLAKFVGSHMAETGDVLPMGEAVNLLLDHWEKTRDLVDAE